MMKLKYNLGIIAICLSLSGFAQKSMEQYQQLIKSKILADYQGMLKKPKGGLIFPYITPGSAQYSDQLWDWDSWFTDVALRQMTVYEGEKLSKELLDYEKGSVLNFLEYGGFDGWVPFLITPNHKNRNESLSNNDQPVNENMHKPVLAQHAAFIVKETGGDAEWLREKFYHLQAFINNYLNYRRHKATGLLFWTTDMAIGVDNDPSTYYRPDRSSGSIYLNCLMYRELLATVYLAEQLGFPEIGVFYQNEAEALKTAIQKHCWDERDGFFYSVDLNLKPINQPEKWYSLHGGGPRTWDCLIQRLGVWSGFLAMWAEIATPEQAQRMVEEHLKNDKTFNAKYGVRTLSKMEKMYDVRATGNPSSWLGPIWGVSNYMVWRGLVKYDFDEEANVLADKTIKLFGRDYDRFGALHEYYIPETGEPVLNKGFQNWNYLVLNMIAYKKGKRVVSEF